MNKQNLHTWNLCWLVKMMNQLSYLGYFLIVYEAMQALLLGILFEILKGKYNLPKRTGPYFPNYYNCGSSYILLLAHIPNPELTNIRSMTTINDFSTLKSRFLSLCKTI